MAQSSLGNCRIAGIATAVPESLFDNMAAEGFSKTEIRKVISMAGVKQRYVSDGSICSSDLCLKSAQVLLPELGWAPESIDAIIFITHSPDYFQPATASLIHRDLGLSSACASFDVGLGCSGYPYGLWLGSMMLNAGMQRVLVLQGETPSVYASPDDRATYLLFGDAGSATALERAEGAHPWHFSLHSDGRGFDNLIIRSGGFRDRFNDDVRRHYLEMNGSAIFNFTIERVPPLVTDTLAIAGINKDSVDYYMFHQSNQFIMKHLAKKLELPLEKVPIILDKFGNTGGPSVPLAITQTLGSATREHDLSLMTLGYGVGLSWGSALVHIDPRAVIAHTQLAERCIANE